MRTVKVVTSVWGPPCDVIEPRVIRHADEAYRITIEELAPDEASASAVLILVNEGKREK